MRQDKLTPDLTIFPSDFPREKWHPKAAKSVGKGYLFFQNQLGDNSEFAVALSGRAATSPGRMQIPAGSGREVVPSAAGGRARSRARTRSNTRARP